MKSKILVGIFIFLYLIPLVNSEESKCPPDCSSPSKLTEESYFNPDSYKNKDFYKNSDPKRWDFSNPNFDYNKIPLEKYKELPYDNPSIDHSRLDAQKYLCSMGCCTCTLLQRTGRVKYSAGGIMHPVTGLANIPGNYPPKTFFIADRDRILVVLPQTTREVDISDVGSSTILTNKQKIPLSNGLTIDDGKLSFTNNKPFVAKNDQTKIEGINIEPKGNDVFVYSDGKEHQGNYVSYGQKSLIAEGNNFDLEFLPDNKFVKVFRDNILSAYAKFYTGKNFELEQAQSDYLYMSLGDENTKVGEIKLTNREDKNLLPLLETNGFLKLWNGGNYVTADGDKISQNYYSVTQGTLHGSVSMQVIVGGNDEIGYVFDENSRIISIDKERMIQLDRMREDILKDHNTKLTGFFSFDSLRSFDISLMGMEQNLGIDFSKFEKITGKKLEILDTGNYFYLRNSNQALASVSPYGENPIILWRSNDKAHEDGNYRVLSYTYATLADTLIYYFDYLPHEFAHILVKLNPSLNYEFQKVAVQNDVFLSPFSFNYGPDEVFPSEYAKTNIDEFEGELLQKMALNPQWLYNPNANFPKPPVSSKVLKTRQAFADVFRKELQKYKK